MLQNTSSELLNESGIIRECLYIDTLGGNTHTHTHTLTHKHAHSHAHALTHTHTRTHKHTHAHVHTGATVVQEVEKSFNNQKVASSIPCRSVLEQDTEPLIAPDVQCAISV